MQYIKIPILKIIEVKQKNNYVLNSRLKEDRLNNHDFAVNIVILANINIITFSISKNSSKHRKKKLTKPNSTNLHMKYKLLSKFHKQHRNIGYISVT